MADIPQDIKKVLWGMNHVMREDPLRRATYGFTIENTKTRLWYCDRTQIIASTVFDFFQVRRSPIVCRDHINRWSRILDPLYSSSSQDSMPIRRHSGGTPL